MEQSLLLKLSSTELADDKTSRLRYEYQVIKRLFQRQSSLVQQYLNTQAASVAEALIQGAKLVQFTLPDVVSFALIPDDCVEDEIVPASIRHQVVGANLAHFNHFDIRSAFSQHLSTLERSSNRAVLVAAGLFRYTVATHMIYNILPAGKSVIYKSVDGDDTPNQPDVMKFDYFSSTRLATDTRSGMAQDDLGGDDQTVPYVEAARRFYLPQWVAFDDQGKLLLHSVPEAQANLASMQHYLAILNSAALIAPYMIADEVFQQKRYGMLGQLVNQGRALANYQTKQIITTIKRRVAEHKLDRGLRLSLPYFDDQKLVEKNYEFMIIPAGRVMFIPAFAVLAAREQQIKVAGDMQLSYSTRKHLLTELQDLELAFSR